MIHVTDSIRLGESEVTFTFTTSSGPGGQNVNKVATAAELRFDAANSPSLPPHLLQRLRTLAGKRMTSDGEIVIKAQRYRSQERNREDALDRLVHLIQRAAEPQKRRIATSPTPGIVEARLDEKHRTARKKRTRRPVRDLGDE
jgi:ribosome-associated protein